MKSIDFFKTGEEASQRQRYLKEKGISTHILVDPLDSRAPALRQFGEVGLYADDEDGCRRAIDALKGMNRAA